MLRLSSWGLVLTRAHQQEASFHLKLSPERPGPWGGSEWPGSQPCPSLLEEEAAVAGGAMC